MNARLRSLSITTVAASAAVLLPAAADAGGIERFCPGGGAEVEELWPGGGTDVTFSVVSGTTSAGMGGYLPGFPDVACVSGLPAAARPGLQSIINAAEAWSGLAESTFDLGYDASGDESCPGWFRRYIFPSNQDYFTCGVNSQQPISAVDPSDGKNMITAWESMGLHGSSLAIAAAFVSVDATGTITDADIVLNVGAAVSGNNNAPLYSFVEYNDHFDKWFATTSWVAGAGPLLGYVDLEAVLIHEIGHLAGLGHSLVDAQHLWALNEMPAMFTGGGAEPFSATLHTRSNGSCVGNQTAGSLHSFSTGSAATITARNAQTLKADDIAAIGRGYPTQAFDDGYGAIVGQVVVPGAPMAPPDPWEGAHVVAVREDDPEVRISTFSYEGGHYVLDGLPPGDYYLYVEPISGGHNPAGADLGYFYTHQLPSYVEGSGCVLETNQATRFVTEFGTMRRRFRSLRRRRPRSSP